MWVKSWSHFLAPPVSTERCDPYLFAQSKYSSSWHQYFRINYHMCHKLNMKYIDMSFLYDGTWMHDRNGMA